MPSLKNLDEVGRTLIQILEELDQSEIRSLILSMTRRCQSDKFAVELKTFLQLSFFLFFLRDLFLIVCVNFQEKC